MAPSHAVVRNSFDAVIEICTLHQYRAQDIYNMDESGFAVGESQSSRALVNVRESTSWMIISGRQEWITAMECNNASGRCVTTAAYIQSQIHQYCVDSIAYTF